MWANEEVLVLTSCVVLSQPCGLYKGLQGGVEAAAVEVAVVAAAAQYSAAENLEAVIGRLSGDGEVGGWG